MAPVVKQLASCSDICSRVVVTGQHRELLDQALRVFAINPDYDLDVMQRDQSPSHVLASVIEHMQPVLAAFNPDWVLVQGDTTTVLGAALAAGYAGVKVGHIEAGLRTYDRSNPFPEELNRVLVDHTSELCFAPTERASLALFREGIAPRKVRVTGNTAIDALQYILSQPPPTLPVRLDNQKRLILVTAHRRESHGEPLRQIATALHRLAGRPDVLILFPVHPNPNVRRSVGNILSDLPNVVLCDPVDYFSFVHLMKHAYIIMTDSGGIQEEAPSLGKPVLVLRNVTERPEAVEAGAARVVGTVADIIVREATRLLDDTVAYSKMACARNVYGDGTAAQKIVDALRELR